MIRLEYVPSFSENLSQLTQLPLINAFFDIEGERVGFLSLIDSGSEYCIFDAVIGEQLGLVIEEGISRQLKGAGQGQLFQGYMHQVVYRIEKDGSPLAADIVFCRNLAVPYGILGRSGFFDYFKIELDQRNALINLNPY